MRCVFYDLELMTTNIKKYDFKNGLPIEFEIVNMKQLYALHKEILINPHRTGFYHILWFQKGTATHLVDFNPVKIKPNTLLFLNKDIVQRFDDKGNFDGKAILFTDNFFCKTEADIKFLKSTILFNDLLTISKIQLQNKSTLFNDLFKLIETELQNQKDNYQPDIIKNLLHNFLLLSEREKRKQNFTEIKKDANLDYVLLFKGLLEINYRTQKKVSIYANQISLTEKRLNIATSKVVGKSPKQIIDDRIMLEAKRILAHTNESVKEVGFALGFDEPTNFIKYFRKNNGSTPVEFRENYSA